MSNARPAMKILLRPSMSLSSPPTSGKTEPIMVEANIERPTSPAVMPPYAYRYTETKGSTIEEQKPFSVTPKNRTQITGSNDWILDAFKAWNLAVAAIVDTGDGKKPSSRPSETVTTRLVFSGTWKGTPGSRRPPGTQRYRCHSPQAVYVRTHNCQSRPIHVTLSDSLRHPHECHIWSYSTFRSIRRR